MKLKLSLVVASMSMLGMICCPTIAAAHSKHKHHATKTQMDQPAAQPVDYKGMGAMVEPCPINDPYTVMLDTMGQNVGRAKPTVGCMNPIAFAGGANFDGHWGNRSTNYQGENQQLFSLNDAYLNVFGNVNDWAKAFASISYNDASGVPTVTTTTNNGQYSNVYPTNTLTLEQGFVRLGDFNQYPVFVQMGKQFQDFGRYTIHPLQRSTTQVLSETLRTSLEVGFLTQMGFHGDVYAFGNPIGHRSGLATTAPVTGNNNPATFGAALGYDHVSDQLGYALNVGYLGNMTGVNDVAQAVSQYQSAGTTGGSYRQRVSAVAIDASLNSGPFSIFADYVTATTSFSNTDLGSKGLGVVANGTGTGAKPWAGNIQAGYNFNAWSKNQNVYLGYQASGNAVAIFLPQSRWLAGYNVDVYKNTNLGLEIAHDNAYSTNQGGVGSNSNTVGLRAAVKFG